MTDAEMASLYQEYAAYAHARMRNAVLGGDASRRMVAIWMDESRFASAKAMQHLFGMLP